MSNYNATQVMGLCRNSNGTQKMLGHKTNISNQSDCENDCNSQTNCTAISYDDKNKMCIFYDANGQQITKGDGNSAYSCLVNKTRNSKDGTSCSQDLNCVSRNCISGVCETPGYVAPVKPVTPTQPTQPTKPVTPTQPVNNKENTKLKGLITKCNSMLTTTKNSMSDYKTKLTSLSSEYNNLNTKSENEILKYKNKINNLTLILNELKEDEQKLQKTKDTLNAAILKGQTSSRMVQITQDVNIYKNKIIYILLGLILLGCVFILMMYKVL